MVAVIFDRRVALEASMRAEVVDSHRRTSEQLFQAQKMEAVGQFTGGVAHDFNNILTIVLGNADAIVEDESAPPRVAERARQILLAGQKASELTRQLLAFSRRQILKPERSDLSDLVRIHRSADAAHAGRAHRHPDRQRRAAVDRHCRSHPGGNLADQPVHQCPRCHAGRRPHHPSRPRTSRSIAITCWPGRSTSPPAST